MKEGTTPQENPAIRREVIIAFSYLSDVLQHNYQGSSVAELSVKESQLIGDVVVNKDSRGITLMVNFEPIPNKVFRNGEYPDEIGFLCRADFMLAQNGQIEVRDNYARYRSKEERDQLVAWQEYFDGLKGYFETSDKVIENVSDLESRGEIRIPTVPTFTLDFFGKNVTDISAGLLNESLEIISKFKGWPEWQAYKRAKLIEMEAQDKHEDYS